MTYLRDSTISQDDKRRICITGGRKTSSGLAPLGGNLEGRRRDGNIPAASGDIDGQCPRKANFIRGKATADWNEIEK